ncbi:hypothetical protein C1752_01371 [Acaryochloris thomasi RCC1774]|uniref:Uncharacterized protein n=1 Tax=Acaryochloris thomasi RCC1774 TaxID=1764569 RepID=A0A2W1JVG7_9CYAN|nr:hypothetical protein C1752_01371 [Acaryochloris thomasi RCC1774]
MPGGKLYKHGRAVHITVPAMFKPWVEKLVRAVDEDPQPEYLMETLNRVAGVKEDAES